MPKPDIGRKSRFLPQLLAPRRNVAITFGTEKLEWCGYTRVKKTLKIIMFTRFDKIHERDRQTDGRTDRHRMTAQTTLMHSIARQQDCRIAKSSWSASCSTLASSTQRAMVVNNWFRASHFVYNSWQHRRWDDGRARLITAVVWRQCWTGSRIDKADSS